jgi:hypothetical protein
MRIRTKVRAGGVSVNHSAQKAGVTVKSKVRAGGGYLNHSAKKAGLK